MDSSLDLVGNCSSMQNALPEELVRTTRESEKIQSEMEEMKPKMETNIQELERPINSSQRAEKITIEYHPYEQEETKEKERSFQDKPDQLISTTRENERNQSRIEEIKQITEFEANIQKLREALNRSQRAEKNIEHPHEPDNDKLISPPTGRKDTEDQRRIHNENHLRQQITGMRDYQVKRITELENALLNKETKNVERDVAKAEWERDALKDELVRVKAGRERDAAKAERDVAKAERERDIFKGELVAIKVERDAAKTEREQDAAKAERDIAKAERDVEKAEWERDIFKGELVTIKAERDVAKTERERDAAKAERDVAKAERERDAAKAERDSAKAERERDATKAERDVANAERERDAAKAEREIAGAQSGNLRTYSYHLQHLVTGLENRQQDEEALHDDLRQMTDGLRFYRQPRLPNEIIALRAEVVTGIHVPGEEINLQHELPVSGCERN